MSGGLSQIVPTVGLSSSHLFPLLLPDRGSTGVAIERGVVVSTFPALLFPPFPLRFWPTPVIEKGVTWNSTDRRVG